MFSNTNITEYVFRSHTTQRKSSWVSTDVCGDQSRSSTWTFWLIHHWSDYTTFRWEHVQVFMETAQWVITHHELKHLIWQSLHISHIINAKTTTKSLSFPNKVWDFWSWRVSFQPEYLKTFLKNKFNLNLKG